MHIVLIPAYEPDGRLVDVIAALTAAAPETPVLVVDDGSGERFAPVFAAAAAAGAVVLRHGRNRGKGAALRTGFAHAARAWPGAAVVTADADGQHTPADIRRVAEAVDPDGARRPRELVGQSAGSASGPRAGTPAATPTATTPTADDAARARTIVLGARAFSGEVPLRSRVGNGTTRWAFRLATGQRLRDTQTGLRGVSGRDAAVAATGSRRPVRVRAGDAAARPRRRDRARGGADRDRLPRRQPLQPLPAGGGLGARVRPAAEVHGLGAARLRHRHRRAARAGRVDRVAALLGGLRTSVERQREFRRQPLVRVRSRPVASHAHDGAALLLARGVAAGGELRHPQRPDGRRHPRPAGEDRDRDDPLRGQLRRAADGRVRPDARPGMIPAPTRLRSPGGIRG
ncbi:glycosyltransferase family 2 protein [Microbacterium hominis]|nr:glycosyltransferase family 2 protein [Microbacterium hominis]